MFGILRGNGAECEQKEVVLQFVNLNIVSPPQGVSSQCAFECLLTLNNIKDDVCC